MPDATAILLVDNGSLQPAATLNLRRIARALSEKVGLIIDPVSLLHSSGVEAALLEGRPAEILEPALRRRHAAGIRRFVLLPLFFGPSAAITSYIPERVQALRETLGGLDVSVAAPLVDKDRGLGGLAGILRDQIREVLAGHSGERPWVILVDHGSPQPAVAEVRDRVATRLANELSGEVTSVVAASMERREGSEYAFNEPLLERALASTPDGPGILALMFFSPGRHAGPGGDIEEICARAQRERPELRIHFTRLVGEHPALVEILAERLRDVLGR